MSDTAFNPMPDQLQQNSGSPAQDVVAPPDQQAALPQPAPAPSPAPPSPDQGGPVPSSGPAPPQDNPNTHGWRAVLKGALSGLENHLKGAGEGFMTGGIPGAVEGAVAPGIAGKQFQQQQQLRRAKVDQAQAQIKFTNAESANQAAEATYRDAMREQMPRELQLRSDQLNETTVKTLAAAGVNPEIVVPNTVDGPKAAAAQLMDKYGAVPSLVYLHVGDALIGYDPQVMSSNSASLSQVNALQKITGGPQYTTGSLKMAPNKTKLLDDALHLFNPQPTGTDKAPGVISQYDGYIRKVQLWSDTDPDKTSTLAKLKDARKNVKDGLDAANAEKEKQAQLRGSAAQNAKAVEVVDPNTNVAHYVSAGEAKAQGLTSSGTAAKSEAKVAQLQDMRLGSQNARQAIQKLGANLTPATSLKVQAALRSGDEGYIDKTRDAIMAAGLPQDQQDFVNTLLNLQERALSLRSIGGQGQGSESQRNAVINLLPGIKDLGNRQLMMKKLDAFDQQVGIYYKNIPKANVKTDAGSVPNSSTTAPKSSTTGGDPFAAFGGKARTNQGATQ